jgi:hypothetical protein
VLRHEKLPGKPFRVTNRVSKGEEIDVAIEPEG